MFRLGNTIERTTMPPRKSHEIHTLLHKALLEVTKQAASKKCRLNHSTGDTSDFYWRVPELCRQIDLETQFRTANHPFFRMNRNLLEWGSAVDAVYFFWM